MSWLAAPSRGRRRCRRSRPAGLGAGPQLRGRGATRPPEGFLATPAPAAVFAAAVAVALDSRRRVAVAAALAEPTASGRSLPETAVRDVPTSAAPSFVVGIVIPVLSSREK